MPKRRSSITFPPPPCPPDPGPEPRPEPEPPSRPALFEPPPLGFEPLEPAPFLGSSSSSSSSSASASPKESSSSSSPRDAPSSPPPPETARRLPVFSKPARELSLAALPEHLVRRVRRRGVLELALDLAELGARRHEPRIGVLELLQLREQKLLSLCERRAKRVVVRVVLAPAKALGGGASPVVVRVRLVVRVRGHRGGHRVAVAARDANRRGDRRPSSRRRLGLCTASRGAAPRILGGSSEGPSSSGPSSEPSDVSVGFPSPRSER